MMSSGSSAVTPQQLNSKAMVVGFALVCTGAMISLCGFGISGTTLYRGVRRWLRTQQEPPTAVMKRKISQAKAATTAATTAGTSAWQNGMAGSRSH